MRKFVSICLCLMLVLSLAACGCRHEWIAANCDTAKTCNLCGEVEGEPLGHKWAEADCETAKHCETCGKQEGAALGHKWLEATTEAPKTCENCQKTEGARILTDPRFHTPDCQMLFGTWSGEITVDMGQQMGVTIEGADLNMKALISFTFHNDGYMDMTVKMEKESYLRVTRIISIEQTYAALEAEGISRAEADAAMMQTYGTDVPGYVDLVLAELDVDRLNVEVEGVYYVVDNILHDAASWSDTFESSEFTVEGDKLTMTASAEGLEMEVELTKEP